MTKPTISKSHYDRLDQLRLWFTNRIEAKEKTGCETQYDVSGRDALAAALAVLEVDTPPDPGEGWRIAGGEDWKDERCEIWLDARRRWEIRDPEDACTRFDDVSAYRVPIDPAPKHPPVPEGWRVLDVFKDCPKQPTDKVFHPKHHKCWASVSDSQDFELPDAVYIRRIEPTYRPFASAEEFRPHAGRLWRFRDDMESLHRPPLSFSDFCHGSSSWDYAFEFKVFDDGSPFGVEVKP